MSERQSSAFYKVLELAPANSDGHKRHKMKQQKTTENYLKAIYLLSRRGEVHGIDIAEYLGVSKPTVSVSLRALESEGYLYTGKNKAVCLTENGISLAVDIYEKNQTLKNLLVRLGVSEDTAAKDACEMEHAISAESLRALRHLTDIREDGKENG